MGKVLREGDDFDEEFEETNDKEPDIS